MRQQKHSTPVQTLSLAIIVGCIFFLVGRYSSFLRYTTEEPVLVLSGSGHDVRSAPQQSQRSQRVAKQKNIVSLWETLEELNIWLDKVPPLTPGVTGVTWRGESEVEMYEIGLRYTCTQPFGSLQGLGRMCHSVSEYTVQPFQVLSLHPRIVVYPGLISNATASVFINQAESRLSQSQLALRKGETADGTKDVRTSSGTFLDSRQDHTGTLRAVEDRLSQLSGVPTSHFEPYNVLRYNMGQHYDSHHDVFDPAVYGPQPSARVATVLIYLAAPEEGGETIFPLEGVDGLKNAEGFDFKSCNRGLKYTPRSGDALMFWSVNVKGEFDKRSLHGGCPVKAGTKWVATKWIRDTPL